MDKAQVSSVLNEIGLLLELAGENPFKARAYYNAARVIDGLETDLATLVSDDKLAELPGLGEALRAKITTLVQTGTLPYYEDLRAQTPPGLLTLLRVPGLGPRKVQILYRQLGLTDLEALKKACEQHRVQALPGFGLKTEEKILAGLAWLAKNSGLHLWAEAAAAAAPLAEALAGMQAVERVAVAGSLRRRKEIVKDIDLLAATAMPVQAAEAFTRLPGVSAVNAKGETRVAVSLQSGIDVDLRLVAPAAFATALHHLTGSREHHAALRGWAKDRGFKLNEYGLFRGETLVPCHTEAEIYQALGLDYIPPELREDLGEIQAAAAHGLPVLMEEADLRGALHNHTSASDGTATLAEMAQAAAALGWEYLGIADHSQAAAYAGGLKPEALLKQWEAIAAHNQAGGSPYLLAGIEAEIKADGSLDYNPEILARFDYVVASVHQATNQSEEEMTARVIKAMSNPYVTVLGHPTGRLLLQREAYPLDLTAVIAAAARYDVALEINASPYRLDLDWRWCRKARDLGVLFWINPDAHGVGELSHVAHGVAVARKGWLGPEQVCNTWELPRLLEHWREKKTRPRWK